MEKRSWLRRRAGLAKWYLTEVWPGEVRHLRAQRLRPYLLRRAYELPAATASAPELDLEVHMLCGEATADMGMWASWSVMRFLGGALLYVHSDGTLTEATVAAWRRIVPRLELVTPEEAEAAVQARLGRSCPELLAWRARDLMARQNIDYFLMGSRAYVLGMDSDVLCFRHPTEISEALERRAEGVRWMRDCMYAYSIPAPQFERRYGPEALMVNGGFWLAPRLGLEHMQAMEGELRSWDRAWREHFWTQQTLLATVFGRVGGSPFDPAAYYLGLGGHHPEFVVRHYPGTRRQRPRFFTEGVPALERSRSSTLNGQ